MDSINDIDGVSSFIWLGVNAVIDTLVANGLLVELSDGVGYNGITTPVGVSNKLLTEGIEDAIDAAYEEILNAAKKEITEHL